MKIGIYDSGIGGLSVLHRALKKMPEADLYIMRIQSMFHTEKRRGNRLKDM